MFRYKFGDRVIVTNPKYCCADVGTVGTIVEEYNTRDGGYHYYVRWDGSNNIYGVGCEDINLVMRKL